jgi:hypothetical protein
LGKLIDIRSAGILPASEISIMKMQNWDTPIVISRKDGDDAPLYLEKQVEKALKRLQEMEE